MLKVDVEGAELDVLAGANELLRWSRPALLVEATAPERAEAITQQLSALGYRLTPAAGVQSWNLFFLHADLG